MTPALLVPLASMVRRTLSMHDCLTVMMRVALLAWAWMAHARVLVFLWVLLLLLGGHAFFLLCAVPGAIHPFRHLVIQRKLQLTAHGK